MRRLILTLPILFASPAVAEVTHSIQTRFGVGYVAHAGQSSGQAQPLYAGRYTSTFSQQSDSGLMFRFELQIDAGNFEPQNPLMQSQTGRWTNGFD